MIIFGTRRTVQQLAMVLLTCVNCHRSAANAVLKLVTKFTLFFIPLFPVRVRYSTQCTACGFAMTVEKAQAEQLRQLPPAGATPQYPPQYPQPQYPQQQYPQQQYPQQQYPQQQYPQQQYPGAHG